MGLTVKYCLEDLAMTILIAAAVLVAALVAGALIAPKPFHHLTRRLDPCALETKDWNVVDPDCRDREIELSPGAERKTVRADETHHTRAFSR
jgi:hypothetical protein